MRIEITYSYLTAANTRKENTIVAETRARAEEICKMVEELSYKGYQLIDVTRDVYDNSIDAKIEQHHPNLITIICNDYRACPPVSLEKFERFYRGTDVMNEEATEYRMTTDGILECYL